MMIPGLKLQDHTLPSPWMEFWIGSLEDEDRQEDLGILVLGLCVLDPFVKTR